MRTPGKLTYEEASKLELPFYMWEIRNRFVDGLLVGHLVEPIQVIRVGIDESVGAEVPSISFISNGQKCRGSIGDYFATIETAEDAIDRGDF